MEEQKRMGGMDRLQNITLMGKSMMIAKKLVIFLLVVSSIGCTTVMYEGNTRPDSEVATIWSHRTIVHWIDGKDVNGGAFKLLPGEHSITVKLNDGISFYPNIRRSKQYLTVLFRAEAGRTYVIRPSYSGSRWMPEVVERSTGQVVSYVY